MIHAQLVQQAKHPIESPAAPLHPPPLNSKVLPMNLFMLLTPLAILLAQPEPAVLLDQSFTLHESSDKAAESQGLYAMHAEEDAGQITITESVQLETKIGTVDLTSIVVYKQGDDKEWAFQAAAATTGIDGNIVMKVNVQPNDNAWNVETTYLRDPRGEALDEPKTSKRTIEVAKGPVLFSSARAVMGPRLQPRPGKLPSSGSSSPTTSTKTSTSKKASHWSATNPMPRTRS